MERFLRVVVIACFGKALGEVIMPTFSFPEEKDAYFGSNVESLKSSLNWAIEEGCLNSWPMPSPVEIAFVFGHDRIIPETADYYIQFQMEQVAAKPSRDAGLGFSSLANHPQYKEKLSGALQVWDWSHHQLSFLAESLPPAASNKLEYVPFWSGTNEEEGDCASILDDPSCNDEPGLDVLFFGFLTKSRKQLCESVDAEMSQLRLRGMSVSHECVSGVFGPALKCKICKAKVIYSDHSREGAVLEVHRINPLLALGKAVVSSHSADLILDNSYSSALKLAAAHDIPQAISKLLLNRTARETLEWHAYAFAKSEKLEARPYVCRALNSMASMAKAGNMPTPLRSQWFRGYFPSSSSRMLASNGSDSINSSDNINGSDGLRWCLWCCYGTLLTSCFASSTIRQSFRLVRTWQKPDELLRHAMLHFVLNMVGLSSQCAIFVVYGHMPGELDLFFCVHHVATFSISGLLYCGWRLKDTFTFGNTCFLRAGVYMVWFVCYCFAPMDATTVQPFTAAQFLTHIWRWFSMMSLDSSRLVENVAFEGLVISGVSLQHFRYCQRADMTAPLAWAHAIGMCASHLAVTGVAYFFITEIQGQHEQNLELRLQQQQQQQRQQQQQQQQQQERRDLEVEHKRRELQQKARLLQETTVPFRLLHGALHEFRSAEYEVIWKQILIAITSLENLVDELAADIGNKHTCVQEVDESKTSEVPLQTNTQPLELHSQEFNERSKQRPWPWGCGTATLAGAQHAMLHVQRQIGSSDVVCRICGYLGGPAPSSNSADAASQTRRHVTQLTAVDWDPATQVFQLGSVSVRTPGRTTSASSVSETEVESNESGRFMRELLEAQVHAREAELEAQREEPFSGRG